MGSLETTQRGHLIQSSFPQYSVLTYKLLDTFKQPKHILKFYQITAIYLCKQLSKNLKMVQMAPLIPHICSSSWRCRLEGYEGPIEYPCE